jgi:hypothetical protein
MTQCPLYNGQNINFTGNQNPYGLIQKAGKRKLRKSICKRVKGHKCKLRKTRKYKH